MRFIYCIFYEIIGSCLSYLKKRLYLHFQTVVGESVEVRMDIAVNKECSTSRGLVNQVEVVQDVPVPPGLHIASKLLVEDSHIDELHVGSEEIANVDVSVQRETKRHLVEKNSGSEVDEEVLACLVKNSEVNVVNQLQGANDDVDHHVHTTDMAPRKNQPCGEASVHVSHILPKQILDVSDRLKLLHPIASHDAVVHQVMHVVGVPHDCVLSVHKFVDE